MGKTLAKNFEDKVLEDFLKIDGATGDRIYDTTNGFRGISNVCDCICYKYPQMFYLECKTTKGNTFPLKNLTQYDKLITKKGVKGVVAGAVIWFYEHENCIIFVPITTFEKLKTDGQKSYNVKYIGGEDYPCIRIPSIKKRVYYDSDYSVLCEGEKDDQSEIANRNG